MASDRNGKRKLVSVTHLLVPSANPDAGALVHIFHEVVEPENPTAREVSRALSSSASTDEAICTRPAYLEPLTQRELEVLHLMAEGLGTQAIAERLVVAVPTVRNHAQRILAKLEVHTRLEAVALASRRGLLNF
jgi:DNA-binding NarL/FixJ family response regulator